MTPLHILITTDAADTARLLAPAPCGGRVPEVERHTHGDGGHCWDDGSCRRGRLWEPASAQRRALPLLWHGTPTGPLAVARALEVLAAAEGLPEALGAQWRRYETVHLLGWACRGRWYVAEPHDIASDIDAPRTAVVPDLIEVSSVVDLPVLHRDLWALATVVAARVPGCGVEVVPAEAQP